MVRPKKVSSEEKVEEPVAVVAESTSRTRSNKPETVAEDKKVKETKEDVVDKLDVSTTTNTDTKTEEQPVKRKRGRPASTTPKKKQKVIDPSIPKRGRGRPKKIVSA
ncbi:uncharacterized protein EV154DRAFT_607030 [Mucor mucedo]|uniref:uncharacterized protein n=1 Tax=Mucor mucedo TaxID=29922 RepID=UPI00221FE58E|nr:uncharacterized protein EV154DRAFT_607030 [Mucor mucedo]KAI7873932.1 hypothetical protein EV154DRAFT_607030 [Mucor mucedo]